MSTYVVTVPGTFLTPRTDAERAALVRALRPVDPQGTDFGEAEDLDILSVYPGTPAFSLRLEVAAENAPAAEARASQIAQQALAAAGIEPESAPLGQPAITGLAGD
ncbi:hypothetical protein VSR01_37200 [Actinacidiphila sp. DG2A-62]|jgi:hypothetical protein|uniref:hypothetical protein n=1 Tax=Actinacidiphila sp. DG2A-62 TaxID=3108821 RepID=UPI002DB7A228|nr:hypothetical protein [Actinacidiphila sp. DG2A-62]MEC3998821.1 hypothetical protein [Actinacidiphila sp. DG2A-62]